MYNKIYIQNWTFFDNIFKFLVIETEITYAKKHNLNSDIEPGKSDKIKMNAKAGQILDCYSSK